MKTKIGSVYITTESEISRGDELYGEGVKALKEMAAHALSAWPSYKGYSGEFLYKERFESDGTDKERWTTNESMIVLDLYKGTGELTFTILNNH